MYAFHQELKLTGSLKLLIAMIPTHILENPTDAQVEEMVQLLTRAHQGDIIVDMLSDSNLSIKKAWHRLGVRAGALEGKIWVVFEPPGSGDIENSSEILVAQPTIVSLVVAFGPGVVVMGSEAQRALGLGKYLESLSEAGRKWQQEVFRPANAKLIAESVGEQKVIDSWVPIMVATDPKHQGRGYASALMRELQKTALDDDTDIFLFTISDKLEAYYEHLGFKAKAKAEIPSPLGNWTHRAMLWESGGTS